MAAAAKGGEQGITVRANIGSGRQFKLASRAVEKQRRLTVRTNLVFFIDLLAAATAQGRAAVGAVAIFDEKLCLANRALPGEWFFIGFEGWGNGRVRFILFQDLTAMRANRRRRINFFIAIAADNREFSAAAGTERIIGGNGGATSRAKFLIALRANISIIRDGGAASRASC